MLQERPPRKARDPVTLFAGEEAPEISPIPESSGENPEERALLSEAEESLIEQNEYSRIFLLRRAEEQRNV